MARPQGSALVGPVRYYLYDGYPVRTGMSEAGFPAAEYLREDGTTVPADPWDVHRDGQRLTEEQALTHWTTRKAHRDG